MLINKVFVTKLIGAGGCMIQEIANFSKGASIKIMSNKHDEKKSTCHDIPVCIGGSFCSVQDATCIIIEQIAEWLDDYIYDLPVDSSSELFNTLYRIQDNLLYGNEF